MTRTQSWPGVHLLATTTDARKAISGLVVKNTTGVPRSGVFPRHTNALLTARADMNVDVGVFEAAAVQFGGTILFTNDGVAQLPAPLVSPGAGITNYYVVYAKQNESTSPGTDANNNAIMGAQLSTTSFAFARAALPTGAVELGTVEIPTGKTATNNSGVVITTTCQYTAATGGVVYFRTKADLDLWTDAVSGQRAFVIANSREYAFTSGGWVIRLDGNHQGNPGSAVTGIDIPTTPVDLPNGYIMKTGTHTGGTTISFGNEYFPLIYFTNPFPNKCLHVSVTQLWGSPVTKAEGNMFVIDSLAANHFRVFKPASPDPWIRAISWFAVGY